MNRHPLWKAYNRLETFRDWSASSGCAFAMKIGASGSAFRHYVLLMRLKDLESK